MRSVALSTLVLTFLSCSHGARILGIFPTPSISHQLPYQAVMKALAARGHQVTVISPDPLKEPVANYTDIDLPGSYPFLRSHNFNLLEGASLLTILDAWSNMFSQLADMQLSTPEMQEFIRLKDNKFDMIIMEKIMLQSFYGLVHHLGSPPVAGIVSMSAMSTTYASFGNPNNPAYLPTFFSAYTDHMNFWERMHNTYLYLAKAFVWKYKLFPLHEAVMRKHFGPDVPPISEFDYNDSLLLIDNHWCMHYPRPLLPNVVELTGLHVQTKTKPLPENIQSFLDGAKHGVIYFSLGSNIRSDQLPPEKVKEILEAFSEIPQRILWKWESDSLPGKPSNVMVKKWLPQQDILAHPNIRAFIMQGGIQSLQEAAYYSIPVIAIPFFSDQMNNVAKIDDAKIGIRILLRDLNKRSLLDALDQLINGTSIRSNMEKLAVIYREEMGETSINKAVWWIEYVIRHDGARHLRSAALDLTWYQYLLLDVIAAILAALLLLFVVSYIVIKKIITLVKRFVSGAPTKQKKH
ncbi:UDP-glucosyltransferase 2 isoform X2 [Anabrus simplex]|uniref:UDP-glucosyltransferase 2 isoform X2 n=1 Tax=Anabrus simplex TaxID=316456 RepID=UPI0035A27850